MSALDIAVSRLKVSEGFRSNVYTDTTSHATIGYGFNLSAGITQSAAAALLTAQVSEIASNVAKYWWAYGLDDARMSVVVEVAFNQGLSSLLHYVRMLAAIGAKQWPTAHDELLDSDAARMLPARYQALATILLTGVY